MDHFGSVQDQGKCIVICCHDRNHDKCKRGCSTCQWFRKSNLNNKHQDWRTLQRYPKLQIHTCLWKLWGNNRNSGMQIRKPLVFKHVAEDKEGIYMLCLVFLPWLNKEDQESRVGLQALRTANWAAMRCAALNILISCPCILFEDIQRRGNNLASCNQL